LGTKIGGSMDKNKNMILLIQKAKEATENNLRNNKLSVNMSKRFCIILNELDDMKRIVEENKLSTSMGVLPISKMLDVGDPSDMIDSVKEIIKYHQRYYLGY
jgi:hypothetical protein